MRDSDPRTAHDERSAGAHTLEGRRAEHDRDRVDHDRDRVDHDRDRLDHGATHSRPDEHRDAYRETRHPAKTSAAAVFSLVFGLSALLSVLTIILSPLALVLGLIGLVLGIVGLRMARRQGVTGRGVAIGGLVLSILALLLAVTAAIGITTALNDDAAVERFEQRLQQLRDDVPTDVEVPQP